jgi:mannose/fructose/N-acetylgalactosamine-specific phosphotransferase system component IIB
VNRFLLIRIDDRLLHGQVALGWGRALGAEIFWIVDDELAGDAFACRLYEAALPEGSRLAVHSFDSFLEILQSGDDLGGVLLLLGGLPQLRDLCERGFDPREVNLGGLHHRTGAKRFLDYVYLTPEDRAAARQVQMRGVSLYAQDLPTSPRVPLDELLAGEGEET